MLDARPPKPASVPPAADAGATNADAYFEVKATPDKATLLVKAGFFMANIPLTPDLIRDQIAKAGVTTCIDDGLVVEIAAKKLFDKVHVVAMAKPALHGKDARIEEMVKVDADITPTILKDGRVDYKNVDNIHTVQAGTVLAVKHPATPGDPGCDIFGKPFPAKPGKDVQFKVGTNVNLSEDGLTLVASKGGFLYHQASVICIGEAYEVKGDLGFQTGNIHYYGSVHVQGNVSDGFTVVADQGITVDGAVDGSSLTSNTGGIQVKQSVFGHGRSRIVAKTYVSLQAVQDTMLESSGLLEVQKLLRNCEVTAGSIKADSPGCLTQGGRLLSYGDILLANVGGEGLQTEVVVLDKDIESRQDALKKAKANIAEGQIQAMAMEKRLKGMKAVALKAEGHITERMGNELRSALQRYQEVKLLIQENEAQVLELQTILNSPKSHPCSISIREKVLGSVKINLYGHTRELNGEDGCKRWVWTENGMAEVSLTG